MKRALLLGAGGFAAYIGVSALMYWWDPRLLRTSSWVLDVAVVAMFVLFMVWSWQTFRRSRQYFKRGDTAYKVAICVWVQHLHGCYDGKEVREGYIALTCRCGENIGVMPAGEPDAQLMERHVDREIEKLMADVEAKADAL